jgi:ankyrin repeat protein
LHVAAQHGHVEVVEALACAGAELDAKRTFSERSNITALHLAAENGFVETVETLLSFKVSINARDSMGFTALHLAVQYGFVDVVRLLLVAGCNTHSKTSSGLSASKLAQQIGNVEIINCFKSQMKKSVANGKCAPTDVGLSELPASKTKKSKKSRFMRLFCGLNSSS